MTTIIVKTVYPSITNKNTITSVSLKKAMKEIMATSLLIKKSETTFVITRQDIQC